MTIEVTRTVTNGWVYDEAGNWLNADADSRWAYNQDNEIMGLLAAGEAPYTNITVTAGAFAGGAGCA